MEPICTVMVYRGHKPKSVSKSAGLTFRVNPCATVGWTALTFPLTPPRLLTQPITLIRDPHCIRAGEAYFLAIKADRATPHPPTPRRPVR
jgi:hypothetical protein